MIVRPITMVLKKGDTIRAAGEDVKLEVNERFLDQEVREIVETVKSVEVADPDFLNDLEKA